MKYTIRNAISEFCSVVLIAMLLVATVVVFFGITFGIAHLCDTQTKWWAIAYIPWIFIVFLASNWADGPRR